MRAPAALTLSPIDPTLAQALLEGLTWSPELGMGYCAAAAATGSRPYDAAYWEKYAGYAATSQGRAITAARLALVERHTDHAASKLDVGIGCGAFLQAIYQNHGGTFGYDVNPVAVRWLHSRGLWHDPYVDGSVAVMTLWDTLEHVPQPAELLAAAAQWAFVSLPIFTDAEHVLRSRHYRRDEHLWYWTAPGLIRWMAGRGFTCQEHATFEIDLGREDIHSFAFQRTL